MPLPVRVTTLLRGNRALLEQRVRARIVLASADGRRGETICAMLGVSRRYDAEGASGLVVDRSRSGRPKPITPDAEAAIVDTAPRTATPDGVEEHPNPRTCAHPNSRTRLTVPPQAAPFGRIPARSARWRS